MTQQLVLIVLDDDGNSPENVSKWVGVALKDLGSSFTKITAPRIIQLTSPQYTEDDGDRCDYAVIEMQEELNGK